jgi:hypothetical protein
MRIAARGKPAAIALLQKQTNSAAIEWLLRATSRIPELWWRWPRRHLSQITVFLKPITKAECRDVKVAVFFAQLSAGFACPDALQQTRSELITGQWFSSTGRADSKLRTRKYLVFATFLSADNECAS